MSQVKVFLEMIKFKHTIFSLPFVFAAVLLTDLEKITTVKIILIISAVAGARSTAMALNRIVDRHIDANNPRTMERALPQKKISIIRAYIYTVISAAVFFLAAFFLGSLPFKIAPILVISFWFYSYTKRFTWLCHFILGINVGMAPLSAWIALNDNITFGIVALSVGVAFWVAGFDIIYACADYDFDCSTNLYSIPAAFGIGKALIISGWTHNVSVLFFIAAGVVIGLGSYYWIGIIIVTWLIYKQHAILSAHDLTKLDISFFDINSLVSVVFFIAILADVKL